MIDAERMAALLCDYCLRVGDGDQVVVSSTVAAEPLLLALHGAILDRGAWPFLRVDLPGEDAQFLERARDRQLDELASLTRAEVTELDAHLSIRAPLNTRELAGIDPARPARLRRAVLPASELRIRKRWCVTLWPTHAQAQDAGMSLGEFAAFVNRGLLLDRDDPVAGWAELSARQEELIARLRDVAEIRIEADGTDLRLRVEGRTWINSDGRRNMPSGEVFTGPHEDSANGTIRFTIPAFPPGASLEGIELTFHDGEVVAARAERGDDALQGALATDPGARRLGELGIGTNFGIDRAVGSMLLDEKIGGTIHLALGRSYAETGGVNESALHWDLVCDLRAGGRLSGDGETLLENGVFVAGYA
jgi:aminopeptidase